MREKDGRIECQVFRFISQHWTSCEAAGDRDLDCCGRIEGLVGDASGGYELSIPRILTGNAGFALLPGGAPRIPGAGCHD